MKKIYGYAALFAAMSLASCSSDNEPNVATGEMQKCYISVNLAVPTDTRAYNYEAGTAAESEVKSVTFVAFDAAGNYLSKTQPIEDFNWKKGTTGSIEYTSDNKVIELTKNGDATVGQIMAIVNCPTTLDIEKQSLDKLRKTVGEFKKTTLGNTEYFVMTNSAYGEGNYATNFAGHVYDEVGKAVADPVPMYVERVASRVDVSQAETFNTNYEFDGKVDGDKTLKVNITGVEFIYAKDKANLVKDIEGLTTATAFDGWDADQFRTHWAVDATGATKIPLYYSMAKGLTGFSAYLNENVDQEMPTYVAVTGELLLGDDKTTIYQLFNNSKYYTLEGVTNQLLGYLQLDGYKYVANETDEVASGWADITAEDIEIVAGDEDYDGYVKINGKEGYKLVQGEKELTNGYTIKEDKYRVYVWGGGNTYFYTKIAPEEQGNKAGVVRNHIYRLVFDKIGGIGTPLFDPDGELLPKTPDTTVDEGPMWYFNASINILKWTVYTQHVTFE